MSTLISQKIQKFCVDRRVRINMKRALVADTLQRMNGSATAEEIWYHLHTTGSRVSAASIYNHLNWLIDKGFAVRHVQGVREMRYAIRN